MKNKRYARPTAMDEFIWDMVEKADNLEEQARQIEMIADEIRALSVQKITPKIKKKIGALVETYLGLIAPDEGYEAQDVYATELAEAALETL